VKKDPRKLFFQRTEAANDRLGPPDRPQLGKTFATEDRCYTLCVVYHPFSGMQGSTLW